MDQNFVCTANLSTALHAGRHVVVKNISADAPVPHEEAWCLRPFPGPVIDPWFIDAAERAREAREAEAIWKVAPKPPYRRADLKAKLNVTDDELNEIIDHLGGPKGRLKYDTLGEERTGSHEEFPAAAWDAYIERVERVFGAQFAKRKAAGR